MNDNTALVLIMFAFIGVSVVAIVCETYEKTHIPPAPICATNNLSSIEK